MNFSQAIASGIDNYSNFRGRAGRSEYWFFTLFTFLAAWGAYFIDSIVGTILVSLLVGLALTIPGLAVAVRRLHDTNKSGWWYWICLVPFFGWIVLIVFLATPGDPAPNRFD